jgi:la-related protein 4
MDHQGINEQSVQYDTDLTSHVYGNSSVTPSNDFSLIMTDNHQYQSSLIDHGTQSIDIVRNQLRKQFEYYFSPDNLRKDTFLQSLMDENKYVSISSIAQFKKVRELTQNQQLIIDAIRDSYVLQLDNSLTKVRSSQKRCVLILREIPSSTTQEQIEKLFQSEKCPQMYNCEFAGNDNWYISFNDEEQAQRALQYLKEEVQTFLDRPILARIKAHFIPRSQSTYSTHNTNSNTPIRSTTPSSTPPLHNQQSQPYTLQVSKILSRIS